MSINKFNSFEKEQVLTDLIETCSEFYDVLDLAEKVLLNPVEAGISCEEFLAKISPFMVMPDMLREGGIAWELVKEILEEIQ